VHAVLDSHADMALVGARHRCHGRSPFISPEFMALPARLVPLVLAYEATLSHVDMEVIRGDGNEAAELKSQYLPFLEHAIVGLSRFLVLSGYKLGSLAEHGLGAVALLPESACATKSLPAASALFVEWGGVDAVQFCQNASSRPPLNSRIDVALVGNMTARLNGTALGFDVENGLCSKHVNVNTSATQKKARLSSLHSLAQQLSPKQQK